MLEQAAGPRPVLAAAHRALRPAGLLFRRELHPYRQLRGIQARFPAGEALVLVEAHLHIVAEDVNGTLACGIELPRLEEWQDGESGPEPRPPACRSCFPCWSAAAPDRSLVARNALA